MFEGQYIKVRASGFIFALESFSATTQKFVEYIILTDNALNPERPQVEKSHPDCERSPEVKTKFETFPRNGGRRTIPAPSSEPDLPADCSIIYNTSMRRSHSAITGMIPI